MFYPDHVFASVFIHAISMPLLLTLILPAKSLSQFQPCPAHHSRYEWAGIDVSRITFKKTTCSKFCKNFTLLQSLPPAIPLGSLPCDHSKWAPGSGTSSASTASTSSTASAPRPTSAAGAVFAATTLKNVLSTLGVGMDGCSCFYMFLPFKRLRAQKNPKDFWVWKEEV